MFKRVEQLERLERAEARAARGSSSAILDKLEITHKNDKAIKRYLGHCGRLLKNETNTVDELLEEYLHWTPGVIAKGEIQRIQGFFWYLKENRPSEKDVTVMIVFEEVAKQYDKSVQVDLRVFRGRGEALYDRIVQWLDGAGNPIEEVLIDYFKACIGQSMNFNKSLLHTPKTMLENFGWKCWVEGVEKFGGRTQYLLPSKEDKAENKQVRENLALIEQVKAQALADGDLELYDELHEAGFDLGRVHEILREYDARD